MESAFTAAKGRSDYRGNEFLVFNNTLQTLYGGNVVQLDFEQASTTLTTSQLNSAPNPWPNLMDKAIASAIVPTAAGIANGAVFGVVSSSATGTFPNGASQVGVIPPGQAFKIDMDGFTAIQVNPALSQTINFQDATGGSLIYSQTTNGTLAYCTSTFSQTPATAASNLVTAISGMTGVGSGNVNVNVISGSTNTFVVTFSPQKVVNPSMLQITGQGLTGGTINTGLIGVNSTAINPGTHLYPVAGQTYASPMPPTGAIQYLFTPSAPTSFTLVMSNNGVLSTSGAITYSATLATYASNIQTALAATSGYAGTLATGVTGSGVVQITLPAAIVNPSPITVGTYFGGTLPAIFTQTQQLTTPPIYSIAEAVDNLGNPTVSGAYVTAGTANVNTLNPGITQNLAPAIAPSAVAAAAVGAAPVNPISYSYPQFVLNAVTFAFPQRKLRGSN